MMGQGATSVVARIRFTDRTALLAVAAVTLGAHVVAALAGVRLVSKDFKSNYLDATFQLLPTHLLRHDLFSSITHLQSQPPLFNLATGAVLELPHVMQPSAATAALIVCAAVVAVATTGILLELGVPRAATLVVVGLFVVADPAEYLYVGYWFYALPTAAIVTAAGWAAVRWARTARPGPGVAYGVLAAAVILTNSTYQLYVFVVVSIPVLWVLRRHWRQAVTVLLAPLLVVVAWYANDVAQFGTYTTSSWIGMNLTRTTLLLDSKADLETLVHEHVLSPLALVHPFSPVSDYGALGRHTPTGVPALDEATENGFSSNLNNIAYVAISRQYLTEDLRWIEHRPAHYVKNLTVGLRLWVLPAEQWEGVNTLPDYHLGGYTTVYDDVVNLQPDADPFAAANVSYFKVGPGLSSLSITLLLEALLSLLVLPIVAWRRRRIDPLGAAGALWIWATCAIVFVTTTLIEAGENNRFRFELGGLPLVAATVAVVWLVDRSGVRFGVLDDRAGREGDRSTGQALAVDEQPPGEPTGGGERQGAEIHGHGDGDR
jgi:hypothetical protein